MSHPNLTPRTYVVIYLLLLSLTLTTAYIALYADVGKWEVPVALGIAGTKTLLVGLFFMHLLYANRLNWLIVAAGLLFFVIMISLTLADYWTRAWIHSEGMPVGWLF